MSVNSTLPVIIAIQNGAAGPINLVGKWLTEAGFEVRTLHAYAGHPLPSTIAELRREVKDATIAAIIPLGGSIGALDDDKAPWLPIERALLSNAVEFGIPVLGICLGAQLLATSLDGTLGKVSQPEIGIHQIAIVDAEDPIFGELADQGLLPTIQWHQDMVQVLPSDAVAIAASTFCSNQIYRVGTIHYGLQFHPEADPTIVQMWEKKADEAYQRSEQRTGIASEVAQYMPTLEKVWRPVIIRWAKMVRDLLATPAKPPARRP